MENQPIQSIFQSIYPDSVMPEWLLLFLDRYYHITIHVFLRQIKEDVDFSTMQDDIIDQVVDSFQRARGKKMSYHYLLFMMRMMVVILKQAKKPGSFAMHSRVLKTRMRVIFAKSYTKKKPQLFLFLFDYCCLVLQGCQKQYSQMVISQKDDVSYMH